MKSRCHRPAGRMPASLLVAAFLTVSMPNLARAESTCAVTMKEQITELSESWSHAVATGNPDTVADFYAEDAVLLPMLSGAPRLGRKAIRTYFEEYLRRHPQGAINMRSIMLGCNVASDIGTYTYRLTGRRKGTREAIVGRYSTLYEFRDGQWLIAQQHASAMTGGHEPGRLAAE